MRFRLASLLLAALPGCSGIRAASDEVTTVPDQPYQQSSTDPKHQLDLYVPRKGKALPVLLFVHGGFWRGQDRRYFQPFTGLYGNVGVAMARRGFVVAVQSYRLTGPSSGVGIRDQLSDVTTALRWVIEHIDAYGGDPTRIVLVGYSAGGHLVTLLSMDPSYLANAGLDAGRIRGVVSLSGILDVHAMALGQGASFNEEVTYRLFGRSAEAQAVLSPSTYLRRDAPPLFALAAEHDYSFVLSAAKSVTAKLSSLGVHATFREVPGYDHGDMVLGINTGSDRVSDPVAAFAHSVTDAPSATVPSR